MSEQQQRAAQGGRERIHWALLILTTLGLAGTAVQLAMERHWSQPWQFPPWVALLGVAAGLILLLVSTGRTAVMLARVIAAVVLLISLVGFWQHFASNTAHGVGADAHVAEVATGDEHAEEDEHSDDEDEHADDEENTEEEDEHSNDEDEHADDEENTEEADGEEGHAEEEASVIDVLTGAADHTPLLAPFALVQVALTLAAATFGLGGSAQAASRRRRS